MSKHERVTVDGTKVCGEIVMASDMFWECWAEPHDDQPDSHYLLRYDPEIHVPHAG